MTTEVAQAFSLRVSFTKLGRRNRLRYGGAMPERKADSKTVRPTRGSALLAVLWLSAALSAIAFTVANTVRSETERTSTAVDSLRAYYIATGAIERALVYVQWGGKYFMPPQPLMRFQFPSGDAPV